jgi:hypothetical protein
MGSMEQTKPSQDGDRPDENPYAPPREDLRSAVLENVTDHVANLRAKHIRRESCIRIAGLIGLFLAGCAVLTFAFGSLLEIYNHAAVEPWRYRRWVARMSGVISIAVLAFVTNLGLFRLRNWGRWALTLAATLPVPALVCVWLLLNSNANPEAQESLNTADLTVLFVMSALSCPPLLFLMWSPKGEMVFSPQYSQTIRQTPGLRSGCSGTFAALAAVSAEAIAYLVLLLTVLSILLMLGLIRSI